MGHHKAVLVHALITTQYSQIQPVISPSVDIKGHQRTAGFQWPTTVSFLMLRVSLLQRHPSTTSAKHALLSR